MKRQGMSRRAFLELSAGTAGALTLGGCAAGQAIGADRAVAITAGALLSPDIDDAAFRTNAAALRAAHVNLAVVPVAHEPADAADVFANLLALHRRMEQGADDLHLRRVANPSELAQAVRGGRLGVLPALNGLGALSRGTPEALLAAIDGLPAVGIAVVRPVHCWKNRLGDGSYERTDQRLTQTGREAIRALAAAGIVTDLSRMGRRSALEALELSPVPVMFAASNAASVHDHPANLSDEQIDTCAARGGVIGISAFPDLVAGDRPDLAAVVRHIEYVASRVGADHVALGLDFDTRERRRFDTDPVSEPPHVYPAGLRGIGDLGAVQAGLASAGFDQTEVDRILGGNFVRLLQAVWHSRS